jgi:hypothetical protein
MPASIAVAFGRLNCFDTSKRFFLIFRRAHTYWRAVLTYRLKNQDSAPRVLYTRLTFNTDPSGGGADRRPPNRQDLFCFGGEVEGYELVFREEPSKGGSASNV